LLRFAAAAAEAPRVLKRSNIYGVSLVAAKHQNGKVKWSKEQKFKALAIAEAATIAEASIQTGIPEGTIKRWRSEQRTALNGRTEPNPNGPSKKIQQIAQQAAEEAKAEVREYVADKAKRVADDILRIVQLALAESEEVIRAGPGNEESKAAWLRALVGVMAQGVEKHQLLLGRPTNRQALEGQVTQRYEYDITQRIIEDPEARDLARNLFRRAVNPNLGGRREE
jgi:hypothetical protein